MLNLFEILEDYDDMPIEEIPSDTEIIVMLGGE